MKLKVKKSRWFYKAGDIIEASDHRQMCMNVMCFTKVINEKTHYIHPDDVEVIDEKEENIKTKKSKKVYH